ncbi:hypothetical protein QQF64_026511 [Cirrhinus molitorella]|uniref:Uncharacterized protein n=1 Tax=Cirrhinus molitorella TaxID=172907 RepID=A0ABR3NA12_9TELE
MEQCEKRIADLERYSRRWNLYVEYLKKKMKMPEPNPSAFAWPSSQRRVKLFQIRSTLSIALGRNFRILQDRGHVESFGVWRAAKSSEFLRANGLRFSEDLTTFDRERRLLLWPVVEKARKEGKRAHFVGHRAFIDGSEFNPM